MEKTNDLQAAGRPVVSGSDRHKCERIRKKLDGGGGRIYIFLEGLRLLFCSEWLRARGFLV